ncbi:MAG: EamA family transporter [Pseudobdellovibrio sp.]
MATQQATHTISNNTDTVTLGAIFVALGAASYGMLSTFVKLAYKQNFTTAEVTVSQFAWGALILTLLNIIFNKNKPKASKQDIIKLMITGTPLGLTSMLYYLCVKYIDASIAVVLLMQSVWIGVFIEAFINKKMPSLIKVIAVILIFFGTLLATNVISSSHAFLDIRGLILGFLTAISFSCSLLSTSKVASHLAPIERSRYMLYGSSILVLIFGFVTQIAPY